MEAAAASAELLATLRLLAALLVPCVALLGCLNGLLWLRRRPRRPSPLPSPQPWRGAEARAAPVAGGSAGLSRARSCLCGRGLPRVWPAPPPPASSSSSSSSDLEKRPMLVPPNSPAGSSWAARGIPDSAFSRRNSGPKRTVLSCRTAFPAHLHPSPFEYGSSLRRGDNKWTQLSSASLTTTQGPGLDSDFGASAGVSLRILSSDSEESPTVPLLRPQQSGRFEWDYYDPGYKKSTPLQQHLPCICSKQYWL